MSEANAGAGGAAGGAGAAGAGAAGAGAGTPGSGGAAGAAPAGGAASDWTSGLNDDLKGYVQNKGFKDPSAALDSYRNLEKLIGKQESLITLPEKAEDAEAWGKVYDRLGRPAKAEDYKLEIPKENGNPEFAKWAQGAFHELGLTAKQGQNLVGKWNEFNKTEMAKMQTNSAQSGKDAESALQKEWGAAYEQNMGLVDRAAHVLGMDEKQLAGLRAAMGPAQAVKFMHSLAEKLGGEDKFVKADSGGGGFGALSPEAARNRISSLRADANFVKRYTEGDLASREEMDRLHKMAYRD